MKTHPRLSNLLPVLAIILGWACCAAAVEAGQRTVGYLSLRSHLSPEDSASVRWLSSVPRFTLRTMDMEGGIPDLSGIDVLWIHIPDSASYAQWRPYVPKLAPLKSWYEGGGRFLFTGLAAMIPHEIGIEPAAPAIAAQEIENDWLFDQKGFQGYRPDISSPEGAHPVFAGLFGGVFTWDADSSRRVWSAGYFGDDWPSAGKVVGVEKAYITISGERKLVIEYGNGRGRGLAAGGFIYFGEPNHRRGNLTRFMENVLEYAAGDAPPPGGAAFWVRPDLTPREIYIPPRTLDSLRAVSIGTERSAVMSTSWGASGPVIGRDSATGNLYDVAGRRAFAMGKERGGIDEVWTHPFRLLRDYRAGIESGDSVLWLDGIPARLEIRPEALTRVYATPQGALREIVFTAGDDPSVVVRYEFSGAKKLRLVVTFRSDLRLMWPYDAPATGGLRYGTDSNGTLMVSDGPGKAWGLFQADQAAMAAVSGQFDSVWRRSGGAFSGRKTGLNQVYHAALYELGPRPVRRDWLTLVMTGGSGDSPPAAGHCRILADPAAAYDGVRASYDDLLRTMVSIDSPDDEFDALFTWAIVGTDRFMVNTPGIGEGLLAGYSTTARGWDGAQKISGRPGYAWYFGRDAAWSGFAIDDYGDFASVRTELGLMQQYQDGAGKIFHEISTSGSVHYDASDATPLYILLAAHYLRASGDTAFLRESWPNIRRAVDYLYTTDTDRDGLIENTNQGHGWVEGGNLYPVHTEFYLAGAWCKALLDASYIASTLGMEDLVEGYRTDGERVRGILNGDFWNPRTGFFNFGKLAGGGYNPEPTVLPATVMYYGLLEDEKVKPVLEQYAGSGFTTDWGVRIVSSASSLFNPQGYHYGSVWPLFTGWTALAEYGYGNSTQGFTHILNNMYIKNHWTLGFVEEVMNGAVYKPSGVCPHQCWSETNVLHPAITGMIGWKPEAPAHRAGLAPRFPVHWDTVTISNLRAGGSVVRFGMTRTETETRYSFDLVSGDSLSIGFAPELPEGMSLTRAVLDGREISHPRERKRGLIDPPVAIGLRDHAELLLEHTGGIGVVPAMPRPEPGDSSTGHRIISTAMRGGIYEVVVEGRPGTTAPLEVRTFDAPVTRVGNARIVGTRKNGISEIEVAFTPAPTTYARTTVRISTSGR